MSQHIGKISFSMYITHFAVMNCIEEIGLIPHITTNPLYDYILWYLLVLVITIGLSTITYYFIEQPFQKIGRHIITHYNRSAN